MSKRIDPPGTRRGMRIYRIWCNMKSRCYNGNTSNYKNYGGRGITVCDEWRNDFLSFSEWAMKNGYKDDLSLDRIDNSGNYEPSNCQWATRKQQNSNRRNNRFVTFGGVTKSFCQWADHFGISRSTAICRLQAGMTEKEALTLPVTKNNKPKGEIKL